MAGEAFWNVAGTTGSGTTEGTGSVTTSELGDAAPLTPYVNGPHAVYDATSDSTFYAVLGAGRDLYVGRHHHLTGLTEGPVFAATNPIVGHPDIFDDTTGNDHGAPTINIDADGYLHVVWGSHTSEHYHVKSDNPRDISAWTSTAMATEGTYPRLLVASNGDLLLFDRTGVDHDVMGFVRSTDGSTWGTQTFPIDTSGSPEAHSDAYVMDATIDADDVVSFTWMVARGPVHDDVRTNLYHARFDTTTETWESVDGTALGAVIDWADHASVLAYTANPLSTARHLVRDDGTVHIATSFGTLPSEANEDGTFTVRVITWNGTAWSNVDTGIPQTWRYASATLHDHGDRVLLLACERTGTYSDVTAHLSTTGATWTEAGTILEGTIGEGFERLGSVQGDGPWLTFAQEMPTDWDRTDATEADLLPVYAITAPSVGTTTGEATPVTEADVRDAGRWEVVVAGVPAAAVTTEDETDWLYTWVND